MPNQPSPPSASPVPAGAWTSTLDAAQLASGAIRRGEPRTHKGQIYWAEGRPAEGGRTALVVADPASGDVADIGPANANVRTLVHEYGGGAWLPTDHGVLGVNFDDQRVGWLRAEGFEALSPAPPTPRAHRFADPCRTPGRDTTIWVRERHTDDDVINDLVELTAEGVVNLITGGHDFYAAPAVSPDGQQLAFITWDHPNMPWDHTQLWVCERHDDAWSPPRLALDGPALQQPRWDAAGDLHVVTDRTGFWAIHRVLADGTSAPLFDGPADVEFGVPSWAFGNRTYDWAADGALWCTWIDTGVAHLGLVVDGRLREIESHYTEFGRIEALPDGRVVALAASWTSAPEIVIIDRSGHTQVLNEVSPPPLGPDDISVPELVSFEGHLGLETHAFYFAPRSAQYTLPPDERPPLLVLSHGGPTGSARSSLDLGIQYWTNRGIGVVDVNYGGSTGFGTDYRNRLRGNWGITDVADCTAAAEYLYASGRVDGDRLAIKGGSAGGFTTLCALVFGDRFAAGISRYGVADLASLATDTHKFEARYLDSMVGPWPEEAELYHQRSPIHHTERLSTPMVVLQGSDDPVVPPSQSEQLVDALAATGVRHGYLLFDGESHGFRQAKNIAAALEAELSFLAQIMGFEPAGDIETLQLR